MRWMVFARNIERHRCLPSRCGKGEETIRRKTATEKSVIVRNRKAGMFLNVIWNVECVSGEMRELKCVFLSSAAKKKNYYLRLVKREIWRRHLLRVQRNYRHFHEVEIKLDFFCDEFTQFFLFSLLFACSIKWELGGVCGFMNRDSFGSEEFIIRKFYNWIKLTTSSCHRTSNFKSE